MAKATILVVDDDALIAMSTADMLADLGHAVIEANSGERVVSRRSYRAIGAFVRSESAIEPPGRAASIVS